MWPLLILPEREIDARRNAVHRDTDSPQQQIRCA